MEDREDLLSAIRRELKEELDAEVDVVCKLGVVSDYYNLIHQHNLNNYFLCRVKSFADFRTKCGNWIGDSNVKAAVENTDGYPERSRD